ncbi:vanadium-dependent haloperoxidase [Prosthecobacter sp.]|uniref:vanadium-dependent haloperoxidase n=1 Tax=Prosthecobacter sp. TaxID=1965333 RepID=UPI002ABAF812|nr:vanadium-dependent haloperoxidase [Prosthecobacter sp.]MDZ4406082.1 vanadium-dependent haloperoxidase [Prosthecobacter sp.]
MRLFKHITLCALLGCTSLRADVITDWNALMRQTFKAESTSATPPTNSRTMGMMGAAMFDAVNSINRTHTGYHGYFDPTTAGSSIDITAAAAAAANTVMQSIYTDLYGAGNTHLTNFTSLYNTQMSGIADGEAKTRGIEVGIAAAQAMITARAGDGWNATSTYSTQPLGTAGAWQPGTTAGAWGSSTGTFLRSEWGYVTPFTMTSGDQFRPTSIAGYQANDLASLVGSQTYTDGFNQVKSLGVSTGSTRTTDQTNIAYFWVDGPGTASPPGHWNRIAQTISASMGLSVEDNARLFALLNLAEADVGIATWDAKRAYDFWRPMIAINTASTDGNGDTLEDAAWAPLIPTPSFPAYTSGHSAFSMAAATILAEFFGTDDIAFTTDTESPFLPLGYTRDYTSFSEAAAEAGMSRIYGGIHWDWDNTEGQVLGANVADNVFNSYFQPVPEPGSAMLILCTGVAFMLRRRSRLL